MQYQAIREKSRLSFWIVTPQDELFHEQGFCSVFHLVAVVIYFWFPGKKRVR